MFFSKLFGRNSSRDGNSGNRRKAKKQQARRQTFKAQLSKDMQFEPLEPRMLLAVLSASDDATVQANAGVTTAAGNALSHPSLFFGEFAGNEERAMAEFDLSGSPQVVGANLVWQVGPPVGGNNFNYEVVAYDGATSTPGTITVGDYSTAAIGGALQAGSKAESPNGTQFVRDVTTAFNTVQAGSDSLGIRWQATSDPGGGNQEMQVGIAQIVTSVLDPGGVQNYTLRMNGGTIELLETGTANVLDSLDASLAPAIQIVGDAQNNQLTVDFTNGPFNNLDIVFDGGGGTDTLVLVDDGVGQDANAVRHRFTNNSDGFVDIDFGGGGFDSTITYTGLEPVIDNLDAANRVFMFTSAMAETITLDAGGTLDFQIDSTQGESVDFNEPTSSLSIFTTMMGGAGADTINIEGFAPIGAVDLTIDGVSGGASDDTINFQTAPTDLSGGDLNADAMTINVTTGLNTDLGGNLDLDATRNILVPATGSLNTVNGTISADANVGGVAGSFVGIDVGGIISATGTGGISLTGTGGNAGSFNHGVDLGGASISANGGLINIVGNSGIGNNSDGVVINATTVSNAAAGSIDITGIATAGPVGASDGVSMFTGSTISTVNGDIIIFGLTNDTSDDAEGFGVFGSSITSSGTGGIFIFGVGGDDGALIDDSTIQTLTGALTIDGTSGVGATTARGVLITNGSTVTSGGPIGIIGLNVSDEHGVEITDGADVIATGAGTITIDGTGGTGDGSDFGVLIGGPGTTIVADAGLIGITGTGGGGAGGFKIGVIVSNSPVVRSTGAGGIEIDGFGGAGTGTTGNNRGVDIEVDALIESTGSGDIAINGTAANAGSQQTGNFGVGIIAGGDVVSSGTGMISITGAGAGDGNAASAVNPGVLIDGGGSRVESAAGSITIDGTGGNSGGGNSHGFHLGAGGMLIAGGAATIDVTGRAATGEGIFIDSGVTSGTGTVDLTSDDSVFFTALGTVTSASGIVTVTGDDAGGANGEPITMTDGSSIDAGSDQVFLTTDGNISISTVTTTNTADPSISVNSDNGAIIDNTAGEAANLTTGVGGSIVLRAENGIGNIPLGATDDLDISTSILAAQNDTMGHIGIENSIGGLLTIGTVDGLPGVTNTSPGEIQITNLSPLTVAADVTANGNVTLTASDTNVAGGVDNLVVNAGVMVTSNLGNVTLNAGDDVTLNATSTVSAPNGGIAIVVDDPGSDPDPGANETGSTVNINSVNVLTALNGTTILGGDDNDIFNLFPQVNSVIFVDGALPVDGGLGDPPGDTLNIDFTGIADPFVDWIPLSDGSFVGQVGGTGVQPVAFHSIETLNAIPDIPYDLRVRYDLSNDTFLMNFPINLSGMGLGMGGNSNADTTTVTLEGTQLHINANDAVSVGSDLFVDLADIRSLEIVGSSDNDILLLNETMDGLPSFPGDFGLQIPGGGASGTGHNNQAHLDRTGGSGTVGMHFDGGGGVDSIGVTLMGVPSTITYMADAVAAANSGVVQVADNGAPNQVLAFSFANLEPMDFLGTGAADTLQIDNSSLPANTFLTVDDDVNTPMPFNVFGPLFGAPMANDGVTAIWGDAGFETTRFANFGNVSILGGDGGETLTLAGIDAGAGNPLAFIDLDGDNFTNTDAGNDTINVLTLPAGVLATLLGGADTGVLTNGVVAGGDVFNLSNPGTNSLEGIFGRIDVSPSISAIEGNTEEGGFDTLNIYDENDPDGDVVQITDTIIDNITPNTTTPDITYNTNSNPLALAPNADGVDVVDTVNIFSSNAFADTFNIQETAHDSTHFIDLGSSAAVNDIVNIGDQAPDLIGSTLDGIDGQVNLMYAPGQAASQLNMSDKADVDGDVYDVNTNAMLSRTEIYFNDGDATEGTPGRRGLPEVTYNDIAHFTLVGGNPVTSNNVYNIYHTTARVSNTISDGMASTEAAGTGNNAVFHIQGDRIQPGATNTFNGFDGNDVFNIYLSMDSIVPTDPNTTLQINGGDVAGDTDNRDVVTLEVGEFMDTDNGVAGNPPIVLTNPDAGAARNVGINYDGSGVPGTDSGDINVTGLGTTIDINTVETFFYDGSGPNNDIVRVTGTMADDDLTVHPLDLESALVFRGGNPWDGPIPADSEGFFDAIPGVAEGPAGTHAGPDMRLNQIASLTMDGGGGSANQLYVYGESEMNITAGTADVFGFGNGVIIPGEGVGNAYDEILMNDQQVRFVDDAQAAMPTNVLLPITIETMSFTQPDHLTFGLIVNAGFEATPPPPVTPGFPLEVADDIIAEFSNNFSIKVNGGNPVPPFAIDGDRLNVTTPNDINVFSDKSDPPVVSVTSGLNPFSVGFSSIEFALFTPGNGVVNVIGDNNDPDVDQNDNFIIEGRDVNGDGNGQNEFSLRINGDTVAPAFPALYFENVYDLNVLGDDRALTDSNLTASLRDEGDIDTLEITPWADDTPRGWNIDVSFNEGNPTQADGNQADLLILHTSRGPFVPPLFGGGGEVSEHIVIKPSGPDNGEIVVTNASFGTPIVDIDYVNNTDIIIIDDDGYLNDTDTLTLLGTNPDNGQASGNDTFEVDFEAAGTLADPMVTVRDAATGAILYRLRNIAGGILTQDTLVGGAGYTDNVYANVPLTGGSGSGAAANITVTGGVVTSVVMTAHGSGYNVGDVLSADTANLGGVGAGFSINVASIAQMANVTFDMLAGDDSLNFLTPTNGGSGGFMSGVDNVTVLGGDGDDSVAVDIALGRVNWVLGQLFYDGGSGTDSLSYLTTSGVFDAVTYTPGPTLGSGKIEHFAAGAGTQTTHFENLEPVYDFSFATTLTVNGDDANNAISYYNDGGVGTLTTLVAGANYADGNYINVPLTGGTGSGASANITVSGGAVTAVTLVSSGSGYTAGDTLSAATAHLGGGAGAGFSIDVESISAVVAVDNQEAIVFANKTNLVIDAQAGDDVISIDNPLTPSGLTGNITVNGGDPSASDKLIVNAIAGVADNLNVIPSATVQGMGTVIRTAAGAPDVDYTGMENITLVGQLADVDAGPPVTWDSFGVDGTAGNDIFEYFSGDEIGAGNIKGTVNLGPGTGVSLPNIEFKNMHPLATRAFNQFGNQGGIDQFLFVGTDGNDSIIYDGAGVLTNAFAGTVTTTLDIGTPNSAVPGSTTVLGIQSGDGSDTIEITPEAIGMAPVTGQVRIYVFGGQPDSGSDTLTVNSLGNLHLNLGTSEIDDDTTPGTDISYSDIETINLDSDGTDNLSVSATAGNDTIVVTPLSDAAGPGVVNGTLQINGNLPIVNYIDDAVLDVGGGGGQDTLVVNGSANSGEIFNVSGTLVDTPNGDVAFNAGGALEGIEAVTVNGQQGSDTFNVTPSATVPIRINGGDPIGTLTNSSGDTLNVVAGFAPFTFQAGPEPDSGAFIVGANQPISFDEIEAVQVDSIPFLLPDADEPNDTLATATVLGSVPEITLQDRTIHATQMPDPTAMPNPIPGTTNPDWYKITANATGKLIINAYFTDDQTPGNGLNGNLDIQIWDANGNNITPTGQGNSTDDNEQIIIPVVSQEMYFLRVFSVADADLGSDQNTYDLEIENFAAPVPNVVDLDAASDTGMMNNDNITSDTTATITVEADLTDFANMGIDILTAAEAELMRAGTGTTPGAAVEIFVDGVSVGFAEPMAGTNNDLYTFTFDMGDYAEGDNYIKASVTIFDGQEDGMAMPAPAEGRTTLSNALILTLDTIRPDSSSITITLAPPSDTGIQGDNATFIQQPAFVGLAEAGAKIRVYANGALVGQGIVNSDESDLLAGNGLGTWEVTVEPLAYDDYYVWVEVEDAAGNISGIAPEQYEYVIVDPYEINDTIGEATVLGSLKKIIKNDVVLHNRLDHDVWKYTAQDTGKVVLNIHFDHDFGDLRLRVEDMNGNFLETVNTSTDGEQLVFPVVSQEMYFIRVWGEQGLYTVDRDNDPDGLRLIDPFNIDPMTGEAEQLMNVQITLAGSIVIEANGLAKDPTTGLLWALLTLDDPGNPGNPRAGKELVTIDPVTGVATSFGNTGDEFRELAFDADGVLYGVTDVMGTTPPTVTPETLFTLTKVNPTTATPVPGVALTADDFGDAIAYNPQDGLIYRATGNNGGPDTRVLESVNVTNGVVTNVTLTFPDANDNYDQIESMTFDPVTGTLLAGALDGNLYTITIDRSDPLNPVGVVDFQINTDHLPAGIAFAQDRTIYDLEVENFQAPVPSGVTLDPNDDSGMMNTDLVTWVDDAHLIVKADLQDFADMGITILTAAEANAMAAGTGTTPGAAVEVFINGVSVGFADSYFGLNTLFDITLDTTGGTNMDLGEWSQNIPISTGRGAPTARAVDAANAGYFNIVQAAVRIFDGQLTTDGMPAPATARSQQSHELDVHFDPNAPDGNLLTFDMLTASDTGMQNDDNVTSKMRPAFTGVAEANAKIRIYANGELVGQGVVGSDSSDGARGDGLGAWEITVEPLDDGAYDLTVQLEDLAGNVTSVDPMLNGSGATDIWVDTAVPNTPYLDLLNDTGHSPNDNITMPGTFDFRMTGNDTVNGGSNPFPNDVKYRLYWRPGSGSGEVLVYDSWTEFGDFTTLGDLTRTVSQTLNDPNGPGFGDSVHNFKLEIEDRAGNISPDYLLTIVVDSVTVAPTIDLAESSDTGMSNTDNVTNKMSPAIIGVGEVNSTVIVLATNVATGTTQQVGQGVIGSALSDQNPGNLGGTFSGTQEVPSIVSTASGTVTAQLNAAQDALSITIALSGVDLDGLQTPGDTSDDVTGLHIHRGTAGVNGPVIFGMINPNNDVDGDLVIDAAAGTVTVVWDGAEGNSTTLAAELNNLLNGNTYVNVHTVGNPSGEVRAQLLPLGAYEVTTEPLADGVYDITVVSEDWGGNVIVSPTLQIEIDTVQPNTPLLDLLTDTGHSTLDNITNNNTPAVSMTTHDPAHGGTIFTDNLKFRIYDRYQGDNEFLLYDSAADAAQDAVSVPGDMFTSATLVNQTLPELIFANIAADLSIDLNNMSAADITALSGELAARGLDNALGFTQTDLGGGVFQVTGVLNDGLHNLKLEVEDRAGNISHDYLLDVQIDTVTPVVEFEMVASSDSGMFNDDDVTNKMSPAFSGISEVGSSVRVYANEILVGEGVVLSDDSDGIPNDGMGRWEVTVEPLVDNMYAISVEIEDWAGNVGREQPAFVFGTDASPLGEPIPDADMDLGDGLGTLIDQQTVTFTPPLRHIADVDVFVDIDHADVSQLSLFLTSPDPDGAGPETGITVELVPHPLAPALSGTQLAGTVFDDDAPLDINAGAAPYTGHFRPSGSLADYNMIDTADITGGLWTLTIVDNSANSLPSSGIDGTLNRWELRILTGLKIEIDTEAPNTPHLDLLDDTGHSVTDNITSNNTPRVSMTTHDINELFHNETDNLKFRIYDRYQGSQEFLIYDSSLDSVADAIDEVGDMFTNAKQLTRTLGAQFIALNPGGNGIVLADGSLVDGVHNLKLEVEDRAGNISHDFLLDIVIDTVTPMTTPDLLASSDTGMFDNDNVTSIRTPAFEGRGEVESTVFVFATEVGTGVRQLVGQGHVGSDETDVTSGISGATSSDRLGMWEVTVEPLEDGVYDIEVHIEDRAGNTSISSPPLRIEIDGSAPNLPLLDLLTRDDHGHSVTDNITNVDTPMFSATTHDATPTPNSRLFAENFKYRIYDRINNGTTETLIYDSASQAATQTGGLTQGFTSATQIFTTSTLMDNVATAIADLVDGVHHLKLEVEDRAGNISHDFLLDVKVDTVTPPATVDLIDGSDTGMFNDDNVTAENSPTFSGRSEAEALVLIYAQQVDASGTAIGEKLLVGEGRVDSDASDVTAGVTGATDDDRLGIWEVTIAPLDDGLWEITSHIEDWAGNYAESSVLTIEIDTVEPNTPHLELLDDEGHGDDDNITNNNMPNVAVTTHDPAHDGRLSTAQDYLKYRIYNRYDDGSGNLQDEFLLYDSAIDASVDMNGTPGDMFTLLTLIETQLPKQQTDLTHAPAIIDVDPSSGFSAALADGFHNLKVEVEDRAGNISHDFLITIRIDTVDPEGTIDMLASSDTGMSSTDNVTSINAPAFSGIAEADAIVRVFAQQIGLQGQNVGAPMLIGQGLVGSDLSDVHLAGTTLAGVTVAGDPDDGLGLWEITVEPLDDGVYDIYAEFEDWAGNTDRTDNDAGEQRLRIEIDTLAPNLPFLDLAEADDTGRHNDDNVTNITNTRNPQFSMTTTDRTADPGLFAHLFEENLKFRIYDRLEASTEVLIYDSATDASVGGKVDGLTDLEFLEKRLSQVLNNPNGTALADGIHNLKLEVEDRAGNISHDFTLNVLIDTTPYRGDGDLHPDSDSGIWGFPATMTDRITDDKVPSFFGTAEANNLVIVEISSDGGVTYVPAGTTVAVPLDGDDGFQPRDPEANDNPRNDFVEGNWRIDTNINLSDGEHTARFTYEDVAGNRITSTQAFFVDTQGPRITAVTKHLVEVDAVRNDPFISGDSLFEPKPAGGPDELIYSILISFEDAPDRTSGFQYDAVFDALASEEGNYKVIGDANGDIPILEVRRVDSDNGPGTASASYELVFFNTATGEGAPLPDDRFSLWVSDSISDAAGNRLDGESGADAPFEGVVNPVTGHIDFPDGSNIFPTGDGVHGGEFHARFTVDSRPELANAAAGSVWVDTNGNFIFDPRNADFTNRDITYVLGLTSDDIFAGNFWDAATSGTASADGFDKLAAYGRNPETGAWRWLIDTNNNGVPVEFPDPQGFNGHPVAGNFDGNAANGDEVGLFNGRTWWFDTNHTFSVNESVTPPLPPGVSSTGWPIVGDFDGDGVDDLGSWADDVFTIWISTGPSFDPGSLSAPITYHFGFNGVRERPVAADMDGDGIDDLGLWVPDRAGQAPEELAEWYFLVSGGTSLISRIVAEGGIADYTPVPFGNDIFAQFGDEFAVPVIGNFDPPVLPVSQSQGVVGEIDDIIVGIKGHQNPLHGADVDANGRIEPLDVLILINDQNENGSRALTGRASQAPFLDVDGNNILAPLDILTVVNIINANIAGGELPTGEAENGVGSAVPSIQGAATVSRDAVAPSTTPSLVENQVTPRAVSLNELSNVEVVGIESVNFDLLGVNLRHSGPASHLSSRVHESAVSTSGERTLDDHIWRRVDGSDAYAELLSDTTFLRSLDLEDTLSDIAAALKDTNGDKRKSAIDDIFGEFDI